MNILFVCSRNKWRSPTAEAIFSSSQEHNVKSAGTAASARIKLTEKLVNWADIIFVMEKKHKQTIKQKFENTLTNKPLIVLDIPDECQFMDPELIAHLKSSILPYLGSIKQ